MSVLLAVIHAMIPSFKTNHRALTCGQLKESAFVITFSWADKRADGHSQLPEQVGMVNMPGAGYEIHSSDPSRPN